MAGPSRDNALDHVVEVVFENRSLDNVQDNNAETIFDRLGEHGKTWKVYIAEPMRRSGIGLTHFSRLKDRFATNFVPFAEFEADAASGDLPDFSFIEPSLRVGHNDYHPACGRALGHGVAVASIDPPSFTEDAAALGTSVSTLGKTLFQGMREYANQSHIEIDGLPKDPNVDVPAEQLLPVLRNFLAAIFPQLTPTAPSSGPPGTA